MLRDVQWPGSLCLLIDLFSCDPHYTTLVVVDRTSSVLLFIIHPVQYATSAEQV